jgi:transposase
MRDETIEVGAQHVEMEMGGRRRVEVIRGVERRRRWSNDEKARITSESFRPGASVSDVARRHGMSLGLLHHWRRAVRREAGDGLQTFVPLLPAEGPGDAPVTQKLSGEIEIEFCGARIRVSGPVDGASLNIVLAAVRTA